MDLDDDGPSLKATLNIFMWLHLDGFSSSEQYILRHEWLCEVLDDKEADAYEFWMDEDVVTSGRRRTKSSAAKPRWGRPMARFDAGYKTSFNLKTLGFRSNVR